MGDFLQVLTLIIAGVLLFWFGYSLFLGPLSPSYSGWFPWTKWGKKADDRGEPGDPQVCPVCSMKLERGESIKTLAFPSLSGGRDRLMYIRGCYSCLNKKVPRRCPVCGLELSIDDYLVCRMFERPNNRNHVHVMGCNRCKNMGTLAR